MHFPTDPAKPIVIAHRGASGLRPEHTLEAYWLALGQGADFIEPDLVPTRDGVLIARHEPELGSTTDVADHPAFANRFTTKSIDGLAVSGWFSEDFTLAEIKTLRAVERIPWVRPGNAVYDRLFEVPTLGEIIALVREAEGRLGYAVGIYPEIKHPTYFGREGRFLGGGKIGLSLGQLLIDTLVAERFTDPRCVYIQSFEFASLIELARVIMPRAGVCLPLVQLYGDTSDGASLGLVRPYDMIYNATHLSRTALEALYGDLVALVDGGITPATRYSDLLTQACFDHLGGAYAAGVAPWKNDVLLRAPLTVTVDVDAAGPGQPMTRLTGEVGPVLVRARAAGLAVHPYTVRAEESWLTLLANGLPQGCIGEVVHLLSAGATGVFIDQPEAGVKGRDLFLQINEAV